MKYLMPLMWAATLSVAGCASLEKPETHRAQILGCPGERRNVDVWLVENPSLTTQEFFYPREVIFAGARVVSHGRWLLRSNETPEIELEEHVLGVQFSSKPEHTQVWLATWKPDPTSNPNAPDTGTRRQQSITAEWSEQDEVLGAWPMDHLAKPGEPRLVAVVGVSAPVERNTPKERDAGCASR